MNEYERSRIVGNLHFSYAIDKPMDIFGVQWVNHDEKIKKNWKEI